MSITYIELHHMNRTINMKPKASELRGSKLSTNVEETPRLILLYVSLKGETLKI